jgi:hypothetical protein
VDETVDIDAMFAIPGLVQLRFVASDTGEGSIVEAALDDVRVFAGFGSVVEAPSVPGATLPARLALESVRPNPFRAVTRIDFALPRPAEARLAVYDISGRRVRTLLSGPREAGRYRAEWDGRGMTGARVAAGVYFFRLAAGGEALTRKVTVMP